MSDFWLGFALSWAIATPLTFLLVSLIFAARWAEDDAKREAMFQKYGRDGRERMD